MLTSPRPYACCRMPACGISLDVTRSKLLTSLSQTLTTKTMKIITRIRKQAQDMHQNSKKNKLVESKHDRSIRTEVFNASLRSENSSSSFFLPDSSARSENSVRSQISQCLRSSASSSGKRLSVLTSEEFTLNKLNTSEIGVFGREEERQRLEAAVEHLFSSSLRKPTMISIKGYSGTGKSVLAQQLRGLVHRKGGIFARGKYEMEAKSEPYTALRSAFSSAIEQLINAATEEQLLVIRAKVKEALGKDWKVLADICPNLPLILGDAPEAGDDTTSQTIEGRNVALRLRFYFQSFVRCLVSPTCPLVLVLDDIQWADRPSLELIDAVLNDASVPRVLLIVTYRDDEVGLEHPFSKLVERLQQKEIDLDEVVLRGLDEGSANHIISTLLRMEDVEKTKNLAALAVAKTGGNPFFLIQFMQSLVDEKKLTYNFGTFRWYWNLEEIQDMMVTDNVAGLLAVRMNKLRHEMQAVLQVASCLGRSFERSDLVKLIESLVTKGILSISVDDAGIVESAIDDLVDAGLLEEMGPKLLFAHDQIQAAARKSISEEINASMKYHIGKYFISKTEDWYFNEHELFITASLCNEGIDLVDDTDERVSLAQMNLRTAQHALRNSAFDAAAQFTEIGIKFLGSDRWERCYDLSLQLSTISMEAAHCRGDFDRMEHYANDVLHKARSIEEKFGVFRTRLVSYSAQERFTVGIRYGLAVMKDLGFNPPSFNPSIITVLGQLVRTKRVMRQHTLHSLVSLPLISDRKRSCAVVVFDKMGPMMYMANKKLFLILTLRSIAWSSKYGVNEYSLIAFTIWGSLCHTLFGDIDKGIMFAEAALQLAERVASKATVPRMVFIIYGYIFHWKNDMRASIQPSWFGYLKGMESGNTEDAMFNLGQHDGLQYATGSRPLDALLVDFEAHVKMMDDYNQHAVRSQCLCNLQIIYKLVGKDEDPNTLSGSILEQDKMLRTARESGNELLEAWTALFIKELAYLFGNYRIAALNSKRAHLYGVKINEGQYLVPRHNFIDALNAVALYREGIETRRSLRVAKTIAKKMKKWQSDGNVNVVHMTSLIDAELAAVEGNFETAAELYKKSIRVAARNGFRNDTALAHERAAAHYLSCQDTYWSTHHISEAVRCYQDWRADAKVKHLREIYQKTISRTSETSKSSLAFSA